MEGLSRTPATSRAATSERTDALYRQHSRSVTRICRALLRDKGEAEDATPAGVPLGPPRSPARCRPARAGRVARDDCPQRVLGANPSAHVHTARDAARLSRSRRSALRTKRSSAWSSKRSGRRSPICHARSAMHSCCARSAAFRTTSSPSTLRSVTPRSARCSVARGSGFASLARRSFGPGRRRVARHAGAALRRRRQSRRRKDNRGRTRYRRTDGQRRRFARVARASPSRDRTATGGAHSASASSGTASCEPGRSPCPPKAHRDPPR